MTVDQRQAQTFEGDEGRRASGRPAVGVGTAGINAKLAFAASDDARGGG